MKMSRTVPLDPRRLLSAGRARDGSLATQLAIRSIEYPGSFACIASACAITVINALLALASDLAGIGVVLTSSGGLQALRHRGIQSGHRDIGRDGAQDVGGRRGGAAARQAIGARNSAANISAIP